MAQSVAKDPERKSFSLKPNESELIRGEFQRHQAALASLLSFIAVERLAWPVDQQTAFTLEDDIKTLLIWQKPVEPEIPPIDLGTAAPSDTAKALEGDK